MTPGMLKQVIRTAQMERKIREFDEKMAIVISAFMSGLLIGLLVMKLWS